MQNKIPCVLMRGGTSCGPFFDLRDLPADRPTRDRALLRIMGSPDVRQIDGLGGGTSVTSRVVMARPSVRAGIDVDYHFAQVLVDRPVVDATPTCINMMTGVGPFAIEQGWVEAAAPTTTVRVYDVNTGATIEIVVETPDGRVNFDCGDQAIAGVPGRAAPVQLNLTNVVGGATGKLFPTGNRVDSIGEVDVSIVDAGNLLILLRADSVGLDGTEDTALFERNAELMGRLEAFRLEAGLRAGLGDVRDSVLPKIGLLSAPRRGGTIRSQYLTPHALHPSHAVSGAICVATATRASGTVAADLAEASAGSEGEVTIEHRAGEMPIDLEVSGDAESFTVVRASVVRTARKIMEGHVFY